MNEGDEITFTTAVCIGSKTKIYVSYPHLAQDVQIGERIFLDDGSARLDGGARRKKTIWFSYWRGH